MTAAMQPVTKLADGSVSVESVEQNVQVHAVDSTGKYLGLVDSKTAAIALVVPPPSGPDWVWNFKTSLWSAPVSNAEKRNDIRRQIEAAEGKQGRALRDAIVLGDKTRLTAIETQIATLRTQLLAIPA